MKSNELRKEFLVLMGNAYVQYGYPEICGWIEGLMSVEPREWKQRGISASLTDILPEAKYPTSVPSVNRALKSLETFGVVERSGSRKTGYHYCIVSSSNLVYSMLQQFLVVNQDFVSKMKDLSKKNQKRDIELKKAVNAQIKTWREWNKAVETMLQSLGEN